MATLEKRLSELESRMVQNDLGTVQVIFIASLTKDTPPEISEIHTDTQAWTRRSDESEDAFKERARLEAEPNQRGILVLFCS